jgi:hypothetical protein
MTREAFGDDPQAMRRIRCGIRTGLGQITAGRMRLTNIVKGPLQSCAQPDQL